MPNPVTCFIVEDDLDDQEIFSMAVQEVGDNYECKFSSGCSEAIEELLSMPRLPEFIFLDLNMPAVNGIECLVEIRKHEKLKPIPVIVYSTSSEELYVRQAMEAGAKAFVTKPARLADLAGILKGILEG